MATKARLVEDLSQGMILYYCGEREGERMDKMLWPKKPLHQTNKQNQEGLSLFFIKKQIIKWIIKWIIILKIKCPS